MASQIFYTDNIEEIKPSYLEGFFEDWKSHPDKQVHYKILQNSYQIWLAIREKKCVGFINALSDGIFYAYIPFIEVLPEYRNKGIGSILLNKMKSSLVDMYAIDIVCDDDLVPYYKNHKFKKVNGMVIRNYQNQNAE